MKIIVAARWTGASNALAPNYIVVEASGTVEAEIGRGEQYRGKAGMSRTAAPYENSREFASRTGFLGNMSDFRDSSTGFFLQLSEPRSDVLLNFAKFRQNSLKIGEKNCENLLRFVKFRHILQWRCKSSRSFNIGKFGESIAIVKKNAEYAFRSKNRL